VSARPNGPDHFFGFSCRKNELDVFRRFFHDFEQSIEPLLGDHVGFIENENLVPIARGGKAGSFAQFAGIIDAVVACGVDFDDVERPRTVSGQFNTAVALSARCVGRAFGTIETPREDSRGRRFPATARPRKQVRVIGAVLAEGSAQRIRNLRLSDEFIERFGSIPTIKSDCHPLRLLAPTDFRGAARADCLLRPVERHLWEGQDPSRTRQSRVTLASFPTWGSWPGWRHARG
jgi:hypothetical protein